MKAQFEELMAKVMADAALQKQCQEAIDAGKGDELLKEMGYSFTLEELVTYLEDRNEDMSVEELEKVAGGRKNDGVISGGVTTIGIAIFGVICGTITITRNA